MGVSSVTGLCTPMLSLLSLFVPSIAAASVMEFSDGDEAEEAPENAIPETGGVFVPGFEDGADGAEAAGGTEPSHTEAIAVEGVDYGEVQDWDASMPPVEVHAFTPREDVLQVALRVPPGSDGVSVEVAPSEDWQDGEVRAGDHLVAILRGAPDVLPEDLLVTFEGRSGG